MSAELVATLAVIVAALAFGYTNGFHDAANAIATSISTRALTPQAALVLAAIGNFIGAWFGTGVAATVGEGLVKLPGGVPSLGVVFAAAIGAIGWNLITWYFGLPSSSTHALFGGLVGATFFAAGGVIQWDVITKLVVLPMVLSPVVGFGLGFALMVGILWVFRHGHPARLNRGFRWAQRVSAAAMAIGHGIQDAAKTMGIVVLALYTGGFQDNPKHIPWWVYLASAAVLALGTYAGGWRIIRTLGRRIIDIGPAEGFAAETVASLVLFFNALVLKAPISTTYTITSAIMGVGVTKQLNAVRWNVVGRILLAWLITFPAAAALSGLVYFLVRPLFA